MAEDQGAATDPTVDPNADGSKPGTEPDWKSEAEKWREQSRKQEERAKQNAKAAEELDKLRKATATDAEKAIAEAVDKAKSELKAEYSTRLVSTEIRSAAAGKLADPADAVALLGGDIARFVSEDGEPDRKAIEKEIAALVKAKPYLGAAGSKPGALPGSANGKPSTNTNMNDFIRAQAGR